MLLIVRGGLIYRINAEIRSKTKNFLFINVDDIAIDDLSE